MVRRDQTVLIEYEISRNVTAMDLECSRQTPNVGYHLYKVPDAVPPIHAESYHVATDRWRQVPVYF